MSEKFYIRTDMNQIIATGHVMRCISIAQAIREQGIEVVFILADDQAVKLLTSYGFASIVLGTQWDHMESELNIMLFIIEKEKITRILVDSYYVTVHYLATLQDNVKLAYLCGADLKEYPVDILICYANYWKKLELDKRCRNTNLLLGCAYVPLRPEFCKCPKKKISSQINRVLIMSGGTDPYGMIQKILNLVRFKGFERIDVICGNYYKAYGHLIEEFKELESICFHRSVKNVKDYMWCADLAISAGGSTLYELCACGTPTISYSFVDNQRDNVQQFLADDLILYAGDARWDNVPEKVLQLIEIYESISFRCNKSRAMQVMVDGMGARRLAEKLSKM